MGHGNQQKRNKYTPRANIKCYMFFLLFYIITVSYFKTVKFFIQIENYELYIMEQILLLICFVILEIYFVYCISKNKLDTVHTEFYKGKLSSILYIYGCCTTYCIAAYLLYFDFMLLKKTYLNISVYVITVVLFFFMELFFMVIILKKCNSVRLRIYCFFRHMICNLLLNTGIILNISLFLKY